MKAVIIDDEEDSRKILANYLRKYCADIEVCGFGESVATGKEAIQKHLREFMYLHFHLHHLCFQFHTAVALLEEELFKVGMDEYFQWLN